MMVVLIIGVGALLLVGVLILVLASKSDVTVMDVRPPPPQGVVRPPPVSGSGALGPVVEALQAGNTIEAIKRYRELTGVGLKEAKDAVEAMARGEPVATPPVASSPTSDLTGVHQALRDGELIVAIKRYREATGVGLAEAKAAVEAMAAGVQPAPSTSQRHLSGELAVDDAALRAHLGAGNLIEAIKRYRELTGLGLKESKDAVEALRDSLKS